MGSAPEHNPSAPPRAEHGSRRGVPVWRLLLAPSLGGLGAYAMLYALSVGVREGLEAGLLVCGLGIALFVAAVVIWPPHPPRRAKRRR